MSKSTLRPPKSSASAQPPSDARLDIAPRPFAEATRAQLDAALAALPNENSDPNYVVRAMRAHFGELFTAADEARVRELVVDGSYMSPALKITAKRDNFWRAGIVHSATETPHPAGSFTEAQLEQLTSEPMLVVVIDDAPAATETPSS